MRNLCVLSALLFLGAQGSTGAELSWEEDLVKAMEKARTSNQKLLIDFHSPY